MYYVVYVEKRTGEEVRKEFNTQQEAIQFYMQNLGTMAYGYIADEEALGTAENVKSEFEAQMVEEVRQFVEEDDFLAQCLM